MPDPRDTLTHYTCQSCGKPIYIVANPEYGMLVTYYQHERPFCQAWLVTDESWLNTCLGERRG